MAMELRELAEKCLAEGNAHAASGNHAAAADCFRQSIEHYPTAEAYTYWGWMRSFAGAIDEAIALCKKAIQLDPDFGNPYNDIGCYLIQKGDVDAAIPWLEQAKAAKRYEPRQFPYMNLGRIYLKKGHLQHAITEFKSALRIDPENVDLPPIIEKLEGQLQ